MCCRHTQELRHCGFLAEENVSLEVSLEENVRKSKYCRFSSIEAYDESYKYNYEKQQIEMALALTVDGCE